MKAHKVDFYFDYISPFSYFAWRRLLELETEGKIEVNLLPIPFGALLNHWGQLGPAEIPPKREYVFKKIIRYSRLHNIPFEMVKYHPFNPILALRLSLPEVAGERQREIVETLWEAGWVKGIDMGSSEEIAAALESKGFDSRALIEKTQNPDVKTALKKICEKGIQRGVFGVPTICIGDENFWGNDSVPFFELYIKGEDPLDRKLFEDYVGRKRGVDRKKVEARFSK